MHLKHLSGTSWVQLYSASTEENNLASVNYCGKSMKLWIAVAAREYQCFVTTVSLQHLKLFLRFDCPEAIHVRHKYHKNQQTQVDKVRDGRLLAVSANYSVAISERLGRSVIVLSPEAPALADTVICMTVIYWRCRWSRLQHKHKLRR